MHMTTKQDIFETKRDAYCRGNKRTKSAIVTQVVGVTGLHRKSVGRRFRQLARRSSNHVPKRRGRKIVYDGLVTSALHDVWTLFHELCAERLQPQLREYVRVLRLQQSWRHSDEATTKLLSMSIGTMKTRIAGLRLKAGSVGRGLGTTKPSLLKELVPIRRGPWENPAPGFEEVDTVAHCGSTLIGDFIYSVQTTDVATTWTGLQAQLNKGQRATVKSLESMRKRSPFPWFGLDPDSGSEFVNWHCKGWADEHEIQLTRTRPYHKNDHARIEQKNYANVRDFVGYHRYDTQRQVTLLNELYRAMEDYLNFFVGSQKCVSKERIGSKYKRVYDQARPAYQRVLDDKRIDETIKAQLRAKYATLNPRTLKATIDWLIEQLRRSVK